MRILYLTANAQLVIEPQDASGKPATRRDYPELNLWSELEQVTMALFDARSAGRVALEVVPEVKRSDIKRYLGERPVNVVHFSGHGDKADESKAGPDGEVEHHLVLMDQEHQGLFGSTVSSEWLREQLSQYELSLLVLNCCWSNGLAEKLQGAADCVIGTTIPLRDDLAAQFSKELYEGLDKGLTLQELSDHFSSDASPFKDVYRFVPSSKDVWDKTLQPIPVAERDLTPARRALGKQHELATLQQQMNGRLSIEWIKIGLAAAVAVGGGLLIHFVITPLIPDRFQYLGAMLQFEPLAVMTAIVGNPLGRVTSAGLIKLGSLSASKMLKALCLRPPAEIERELETGRIAAMFEWLEAWKKTPEITLVAPKSEAS